MTCLCRLLCLYQVRVIRRSLLDFIRERGRVLLLRWQDSEVIQIRMLRRQDSGEVRRSLNQGRVISHSLLHSPEILVAYQKYRFDTDQQITQGPIPKQSIVRRLLNLHQDTSVSRSLVEAKHNLFGGKQGWVLLIRWQDSEMTLFRTCLFHIFSITEIQWKEKMVMRQLRFLTIFDPG